MKKRKFGKKALLAAILGLALPVPYVVPAFAADNGVTVKKVEFIGMDAPSTVEDMAKTYSAASVNVTYNDGSVRSFPLSYQKLFKSTDTFNGMAAGQSTDAKGNPIMDTSVPGSPVPFVSDDPDSNSLMKIDGAKDTGKGGNPLSLITHYEYITSNAAGKTAYGVVPASLGLSTIDQNKKTGELTVTDMKKVDFSQVGGIWIPCNGSLTPWNTHLSSEEYEADARAFEANPKDTYVAAYTQAYYQDANMKGNPYVWGYIPEVTVKADNSTSVVKHYSMGRFSHELGKVAPDGKTVFFGDDGGNTMLFLYVADKATDLSAGTLYAAKWNQKTDVNGGSADLNWIKLGHAADNEIKTYIDKNLKFSDLFETADKDTAGFTKIKTYPSGKTEWLKVKPGMEKAAAFLESRRYGAIMGATGEFNKMEGVTVNAKDNKLYVAMSYMEKAMEKDAKGEDPTDHIQLKKIKAGVTYEMPLAGDQKDNAGAAIDSTFVPTGMNGLVVGEDLAKPDVFGNTANPDKVANPDNLSFSEDMRTLFIGEDSGMHVNNFVWAYNVDTKKLSRILSLPSGAEATGLQAVDNLNGFKYLMSNLQHPGDEMILAEPYKSQVGDLINKNFDNKKSGVVGYLSGLPQVGKVKQSKEERDADRTLAKLRDALEAVGATVEWNETESKATVTRGDKKLVLTVGKNEVTINGETRKLPEAIRVINGKTQIPNGLLNEFLED